MRSRTHHVDRYASLELIVAFSFFHIQSDHTSWFFTTLPSVLDMKRAVGIEKVGVILALAISPFWFYNLFGVNLGIFDILMIGVLGVYSLRSCEFLIGLTRLSTTAVLLFLLASVVSIFGSPRPVEGLKNVFQYLLIFMVSVPISAIVFREYLTRYFGLLTLWFSLNVLLIWALLGATDVSALL